jgi:hypothetical protein
MNCSRCGKVFPSEYYFKDEGRLSPLICTTCFDSLSDHDRDELLKRSRDTAETTEGPSPGTLSRLMGKLRWAAIFLLAGWIMLFFFINLSHSSVSQRMAYKLGGWVPVLFSHRFAIQEESFIDRTSGPDAGIVQISTTPTGDLRIQGKVTFRMGAKGFEPVFWAPGVTHTWVGKNNILGYTFDSDTDWPLVFKVDKEKGYHYLRGKGSVTMPDGKVVFLP